MQSYLDCIPCFVRQTLQAARFVTDDVGIHERVLRDVLRRAAEMDLGASPPVMGRYIHELIRRFTGNDDPYRTVKEHFNGYALKLLPGLRVKVENSPDPLEAAVRLAIAGNVIDFGTASEVNESYVSEAIEQALSATLPGAAVGQLRKAIEQADEILYLADNAGEIVFDRLLIERMPLEKVTVVVKGGPVINDATMTDAEAAGLCELVRVVDNGTAAPGTILEICSGDFRERFQAADLIISKGQGNYETLSDVTAEIFFLLKAKCPVIARDVGCQVGDLVVRRGQDTCTNRGPAQK